MCFSATSYDDSFYPEDNEADIWAYYSVNNSFDGVSNSINIIVENPVSETNETLEDWREAEGTDRYAYLERNGSGEWLEEYSQLEKGNYYSKRKHLRLYNAGDSTIIQGHKEFWNWFTLRHEVVSNEKTVNEVENNLADSTKNITKYDAGNDDFLDSSGWITVIQLSLITLVAMLKPLKNMSKYKTELKLFSLTVSTLLVLKSIPIALEPTLNVNNHLITFTFYILIFSMLPLTVYKSSTENRTIPSIYSLLTAFLLVFFIDAALFKTSYIPSSYVLQYFGFGIIVSCLPLIKSSKVKLTYNLGIWITVYVLWLTAANLGFI